MKNLLKCPTLKNPEALIGTTEITTDYHKSINLPDYLYLSWEVAPSYSFFPNERAHQLKDYLKYFDIEMVCLKNVTKGTEFEISPDILKVYEEDPQWRLIHTAIASHAQHFTYLKENGKDKIAVWFALEEGAFAYCGIYYTNESLLKNIVEQTIEYVSITKAEKQKNKVFVIAGAGNDMELTPFDVKKSDKLDIKLNYGSDFVEADKRIMGFVKENSKSDDNKGIVLLHGLPGTGKTYYIRHLSSVATRKLIFVPPNFIDAIAQPNFVTFMMKNCQDSVLILEDAEQILVSRGKGNVRSNAISNILQMSDGLLGDLLNIGIIATFNVEEEEIDKAILRDGRLHTQYFFDSLSIEDGKAKAKSLGIDENEITKKMTLAEIYNFGKKNVLKKEKVEKKPMGFGV